MPDALTTPSPTPIETPGPDASPDLNDSEGIDIDLGDEVPGEVSPDPDDGVSSSVAPANPLNTPPIEPRAGENSVAPLSPALAARTGGMGGDGELSAFPSPGADALPTGDLSETSSPDPKESPEAAPEPLPPEPLPLEGVKIGIDPGHQSKANRGQEPIAPGSKATKDKVSSGTAGKKTRVDEYVVNLDVSFMLRDALEELGAEVYMTREAHDVNISNIERAVMMNELGVDLVLRIHCNGSNNSATTGIGLYIRKTGEGADECLRAAEALLPAMVAATGAKATGIHKSDTYTGLNWSTVPSILVEMGFMSNPEEDVLLNDPEYQQKLVQGMVEGIADYMEEIRTTGTQISTIEPLSPPWKRSS